MHFTIHYVTANVSSGRVCFCNLVRLSSKKIPSYPNSYLATLLRSTMGASWHAPNACSLSPSVASMLWHSTNLGKCKASKGQPGESRSSFETIFLLQAENAESSAETLGKTPQKAGCAACRLILIR